MEWTVVEVLVVIVGLIITVTAPMIANAKATTKLSGQINFLISRIDGNEKDFKEFKEKAADKHGKLFVEINKHENTLINHEGRIYALEKNNKRREKE